MSPELPEPGSPQDWLRHARSDLAIVCRRVGSGVLPSTLCFHAQQAAEKALKAALVARNVQFPYTHDIARLVALVTGAGIDWPEDLNSAAGLTDFAVRFRYPGPADQVTGEHLRHARRIATEVVRWAERTVGPRAGS